MSFGHSNLILKHAHRFLCRHKVVLKMQPDSNEQNPYEIFQMGKGIDVKYLCLNVNLIIARCYPNYKKSAYLH